MSVQDQIDRLIAVRAAEWYEAIRSGESETSSDEFRRWISESPRHVDAFIVIAAQAPLIREVLQSTPVDLDALRRRSADVVALTPTTGTLPKVDAELRIAHRRARSWIAASLVASVAVFAILTWTLAPRWQHLATGAGEQRTVTLTDGSSVRLNTRSVVDVRLRTHSRDVRLFQGEAVFKVAHDKARPFSVRTPSAIVTAVGTEFAVSVRNEHTTVTVLEGKVSVASVSAAPAAPVRLPLTALVAGQEAEVDGSGSLELEPQADVASSTAWLQRKVVFRHALLEDMVTEVNRYNSAIQLHIDGVRPGVYRFSGTFDASDPSSLADVLAREPGLSVERAGNDIYIRENKPTS
jgi:transmembrane sensor